MKLTSQALPSSETYKANEAAHLEALPMTVTVTGKVIRRELKAIAKAEIA